ncbi:MAG: DegT/DnrJ/EryC1/StrS family aminotransferase [Candidatus Harrisonbacteria bacterium]|nr:DegT/DnrJ/EryC1/StrS family aminotransferase [Candidatus Harrisonbacteria bacterium]
MKKTKKKYSIAKPYITKKEEQYVLEVLRSGILSIGPKIELFEKKFADFMGVKYACAVSSGTAGLHLTMIAAGIGPGDEVITTPFSFVASANSILYVGAKPVFVDIDPVTYNMNPAKIEEKITKKTKAILAVHIFGQATDMDPIMKIAKKYKLKIIEDVCESIGATYKGRKVGTFGESAVFAFYPNKQMTTGEGGMIVTNDKKSDQLFRSLRNQGRAENMQWLDHERLGYNYRMDELSAAAGLAQIEKIDFLLSERRKVAEMYTKYLKPHSDFIQVPVIAPANIHTWFVYVVSLKNKKINRNQLIEKLAAEGISTKPYLPSIHLFSFYKNLFGYKEGDFPISENVSNKAVALPFYIGLKESDIKYICEKLISTIKKQ